MGKVGNGKTAISERCLYHHLPGVISVPVLTGHVWLAVPIHLWAVIYLSMLMAHRLRMLAVHIMTSRVSRMSQCRRLKRHSPTTCQEVMWGQRWDVDSRESLWFHFTFFFVWHCLSFCLTHTHALDTLRPGLNVVTSIHKTKYNIIRVVFTLNFSSFR